jgi:hypothetical protein
MIRLFEANLNGPRSRERALILIGLCVGGMVWLEASTRSILPTRSARQFTNKLLKQRVGARVNFANSA